MSHIHELIDYTADVFIVYKEKVLLRFHEKYNIWLQVGGHIELNETPQRAALREVREETGLDVELIGGKEIPLENNGPYTHLLPPLYTTMHPIGETHKHILFVYFAKANSDKINPSEQEEPTDFLWLTAEELDEREDIYHTVKFLGKEAINVVKKTYNAHKSPNQLQKEISTALEKIPPGSIWKHHKSDTDLYKVVGIGINQSDTEDDEKVMVFYKALYERLKDIQFARSVENFLQDKLIHGKIVPRFSRIEKPVKIAIATQSNLKVQSTKLAFESLSFTPIKIEQFQVSSGVSEQPLTLDDTVKGAFNRLKDLKDQNQSDVDFYVSIEGGYTPIEFTNELLGVGVCVIEDKNGRTSKAVVSDYIIGQDFADAFDDESYKMKLYLINKKGMKAGTDPIEFISNGVYSRAALVQKNVEYALKQILLKEGQSS